MTTAIRFEFFSLDLNCISRFVRDGKLAVFTGIFSFLSFFIRKTNGAHIPPFNVRTFSIIRVSKELVH